MIVEFRIALKRGSGRAMLLLREQSADAQMLAALLHACVNDLRYDTDEESRAAYLYGLIRASHSSALWRDELFSCLNACRPGDDGGAIVQIFGILCRLAREDETLDRAKLWAFLATSDYSTVGSRCAGELVRLEGVEALFKCLSAFPDEFAQEEWHLRGLIDVLENRDGVDQSTAQLQEARSHLPTLDALMLQLEADRKPSSSRSEEPIDYATAKAELEDRGHFPSGFIRNPGSESLALAARDLLAETRLRPMKSYLRLFGKWDFPLPPALLLGFIHQDDDRVSYFASRALGRLSHLEIRKAALDLVEKRRLAQATRLLARSYQPGDIDYILTSLDAEAASDDELHSLQFAVREVLSKSSVQHDEAVRMLMRMYELNPCSMCRASILRALDERITLPPWVLEECAFDAEPDVVAIAERSRVQA